LAGRVPIWKVIENLLIQSIYQKKTRRERLNKIIFVAAPTISGQILAPRARKNRHIIPSMPKGFQEEFSYK
jgi:hypothetical protein